MEQLKEVIQFMQTTQRLDLKTLALDYVLSLTGSSEGKAAILAENDILVSLFNLTTDTSANVSKDAVLCLINLSADENGAVKVFQTSRVVHPKFEITSVAVNHIINENSELADPWSMVLSNLTRVESLANEILNDLEMDPKNLPNLVKAFIKLDYNKKKAKLHYLAPIFCNLTQTTKGRELFCHNKYNLLDKIIPFASYKGSLIRRGGTIGIIKNICFDPLYHNVILREPNDILCAILYPLCGPEEFTDQENERLPLELQYLPESKTREEDPDLRKMLLESLLQLCSTRKSRDLLRQKGVYEILREYHKWEAKEGRDMESLLACEKVVDILIKKEDEIGLDNYKQLDVPEDYAEKFFKEDEEYLNELQ